MFLIFNFKSSSRNALLKHAAWVSHTCYKHFWNIPPLQISVGGVTKDPLNMTIHKLDIWKVFEGAKGGVMDSKPFIRSSNIWGRMVLSFLGPKVVLFYEIIGGAFNAPHQLTYIFDPAGNRVKLCHGSVFLKKRNILFVQFLCSIVQYNNK